MNFTNITTTNNTCLNCTTVPPMHAPPMDRSQMYAIIGKTSLQTFVFVGALMGNLFIIAVITRKKKMQTITNWLVFNLAISDMGIVFLSILLPNILQFVSWPFGKIGCKYLIMPVTEHLAGVCVLTHTALGLARYYIVKNAMHGKTLKIIHVKIAIASIWLVAFLTMSVTIMGDGILGKFVLRQAGDMLLCEIRWISLNRRIAYRVMVFSLTYVVPMVATGYAYYKIHTAVEKSMKHLSGHMSNDTLLLRRRKTRRMNRVLMTMYVIFAITTLPLQVFYVVSDFGLIPKSFGAFLIWNLLVVLFCAQVVTNPLILFYMGDEYRTELYKLPICCCVANPRFRRISYIVKGSFKGIGRHYKSRKSIGTIRSSVSSYTKKSQRLLNGNKKLSHDSHSISDDAMFHNIRHNNNGSNGRDILQVASFIPALPILTGGYIEESGTNKLTVPNGYKYNEASDNASSDLYNSSDSQEENYMDSDRTKNFRLDLMDLNASNNNMVDQVIYTADDAIIPTPKRGYSKKENFVCEKINLSAKFSELELMDNPKSPSSLSAYYDDGTLMYFYDEAVGTVSFEYDTGRETTI